MLNSTPLAVLGAMVFALLLTSPLSAQSASYDPYAPQVEEPPISADGTLHWPTFYRSKSLEASYENLWMLGACQGTNKRITIPVANNRVDIDRLPEGKVEAMVLKVGNGRLFVRQTDGTTSTLATHPAGVSRIHVTGDVSARLLTPGIGVRLVSTVNESGHSLDRLSKLDIVTIPPGYQPDPVVPGKRQSIVAVVVGLRGDHLVLKTPAGSLHRLSFLISDETIAHIDAKDLKYASVGDKVEAKGHLYRGQNNERWVFASDVTVTKPEASDFEKPQTEMVSRVRE